MTIRQIMKLQDLPEDDPQRIFAVGKYQFTPDTLDEVVRKPGVNLDTKFTPRVQEHLFRHGLLVTQRPDVRQYITGAKDDPELLEAAQLALAKEFASVASPYTGVSYYDKKPGQNSAKTTAKQIAEALQAERQRYQELRAAAKPGESDRDIWNRMSPGLEGRYGLQ